MAGEVISFGELARSVRQCANRLLGTGLTEGSWVPVVDDASKLSVASVLALARLRCAAVLFNPRLSSQEIGALAERAKVATTTIAGSASANLVTEALGRAPLGSAELLVGEGAVDELREPEAEDVSLVLFTSGTTGLPKPVPLTQGSVQARIDTFAAPFDPAVPPAVSLMCVPLVHIGGMLGLLVQLAAGNTTVVQPRFEAGEWLELVSRHRVSRVFLVPTMLHRILDHPRFAESDLSSLKQVAYGAAPASPELVGRALQALPGVSFSNVFGQTETLGAITSLGPGDHAGGPGGRRRIASVGRPLPGVEVRIVDVSTGEDVAPGEVGELWARTSYTSGWTRTGDLVRQDEDGYLYVSGRIGDTINRGGEKFSPQEVEQVVRAHPRVVDVAVTGVPDPEMGTRVGAAVVVDGALDPQELRSFCKARLASFKVPEVIAFVEEIPYNETGKVKRRELGDLISSRLR